MRLARIEHEKEQIANALTKHTVYA